MSILTYRTSLAAVIATAQGVNLSQMQESGSCECLTGPVTSQTFCDEFGCILEAVNQNCEGRFFYENWGTEGCQAYDHLNNPEGCPLELQHCSTPWCLVSDECNDPLKQKVNLFGDNDNLYISYLPCTSDTPFDRTEETSWVAGDYEMCVA